MSTYNDIGITRELDWPRIKKLMVIGLIAGGIANPAVLAANDCTVWVYSP